MRVYLAGMRTSGMAQCDRPYQTVLNDNERWFVDEVRYHLESYHYIGKGKAAVRRIRKDGVTDLFLDSGAFSAFSLGANIDLKKYCRFIKEHDDFIGEASVLDSIGSARGTYENQIAMENEGVNPLPCFHYGEDERYLEYYIANYDHITLGGMVPVSNRQLTWWLDRLWGKYLTDDAGRPRLKVHGFGMTSISLMKRYPWFSVDSSSWVAMGARGNIFIPHTGKTLPISEQSPARKMKGQHYANLPEVMQTEIKSYLDKWGLDVDRAATIPYPRWAFNCWAFHHLAEINHTDPDERFTLSQPGLF